MIKGNKEDQLSVQNDSIDLMDNSPSSIIEKQTKVIDISVDESPDFQMQKPSEDQSIQFSFVELIIAIGLALVVGFIGALFLINRKTIKFDEDDMPQDYSKTLISINNLVNKIEKKFAKKFNVGVCHPGSIPSDTGLLKNTLVGLKSVISVF